MMRGYTIIEMIIVIGVATFTLLATVAAIIIFYRSNTKSLNQAYAIEGARSGLERAVGDIRGIQYGADGSYPIGSFSTSSFTFYTDTNGDGIAEKVTYYLSGTKFIRGVAFAAGSPPTYGSQSTTTLTSSMRNALEGVTIFHYYNASSTEITTFSTTTAIAYVTIALIVNSDTSTSTGDYSLHSTAALRNTSQF